MNVKVRSNNKGFFDNYSLFFNFLTYMYIYLFISKIVLNFIWKLLIYYR